MDDFEAADLGLDDPALGLDDPALGLDDPALGLDDPELLGEVDVPDDLDVVGDLALSEVGEMGGAVGEPALGVGGTVGEVVVMEYYEETISWLPDPLENTSPEAAGVVGTVSAGSVLAGGARFVGAVRSVRDVASTTRTLGKKMSKKLRGRRGDTAEGPGDAKAE